MKKAEFLKIAARLNERFNVVPLLFGSLGLEQRLNAGLNADDVDVLVPEALLSERWEELVGLMNDCGYALCDIREHEFKRAGLHTAFAAIESLTPFAGVDLTHIPIVEEGGVRYHLLDLQDYLKVYSASLKDGYRKDVKNKDDSQKIELIKAALEKEKG